MYSSKERDHKPHEPLDRTMDWWFQSVWSVLTRSFGPITLHGPFHAGLRRRRKGQLTRRRRACGVDSLGRVDVLKVGAGVQPRELDPDKVALVPVVALSQLDFLLLGTVSPAKPARKRPRRN